MTADVIHELVALLDRSEALAKDLQELDRTKSELIQILSHELSTPMTTIQGFAMLVSEHGDELTADEVRDLAEGVVRANDRLKRLVGNLAAAARLDREGVEVATRPGERARRWGGLAYEPTPGGGSTFVLSFPGFGASQVDVAEG